MTGGSPVRLLVAATAALVVLACSVQETVVADLPARTGDEACARNDDCAPGAYCAKSTCAAAVGRCERKPLFCSNEAAAVCGCNGVSYWNECLLRQDGEGVRERGDCVTEAAACGGPRRIACPPRAACAVLIDRREACAPALPGVCWVLPLACASEQGEQDGGAPRPPLPQRDRAWRACGDSQACIDTCAAIRTGAAFQVPDPQMCR